MPDTPQKEDDTESLLAEIENLKVQNLLLEQEADFRRRFTEHVTDVDGRLRAGKFQLGLAGLVVLCIAWYGTYQKLAQQLEQQLGQRVQTRLDQEFNTKGIQERISRSATDAAHRIIQQRLVSFGNAESDEIKCLIDRLGRDLFFLQCHTDGGDYDVGRGACVNPGGERFSANAFPKINCGEISETHTSHAPVQATSR